MTARSDGWLRSLKEIARAADARWARAAFQDDALEDIALEAFGRGLPSVDLDRVVDGLLSADLPLQTLGIDNSFGQPPFSIFESDKLVMQVLLWHDGTTVIHQLNFNGAFGVLLGGSLHCRFDFSPQRVWSPHLMVGNLVLQHADRLAAGDVRPIGVGDKTIHSLFHLGAPSISVVLRSRHPAVSTPQLNYVPPGLATDPFHRSALAERRRLLIGTLFSMDHGRRLSVAVEHIGQTDPVDAVALVREVAASATNDERRALIAALAASHGDELRVLEPALGELRRRGNLIGRRAKITDPDARYLLALLLNAPDRATYLTLAETHANNPVACTIETLRSMKQQAAETGDDEAGLGIDLDEASLFALAGWLNGENETQLLAGAPSDLNRAEIQKACFLLPHMSALTPLFK